MQSDDALEYMCPYCGTINNFLLNGVRDMYREKQEACSNCNRILSLTPAEGIGGSVNLIIDAVDSDKVIN